MKKALYTLGLARTLALAPCQSQPKAPKATSTVYQGVLPCADCAGIKTTLTLYRDQDGKASRYELDQAYLGKGREKDGNSDRGNWAVQRTDMDGRDYPVFVLNPDQPDDQMRFLQNATNAVELLNAEGKRINSEFNYTLMQQ